MGNYNRCNVCNTWHYDRDNCPPEYFISYEDYLGDEWKKVHANSHYDAALKFAEYYNSNCDYVLMDNTIDILVKDSDGKIIPYQVGAEQSVDYSANEILPKHE